ncbi:tripartite tricarboxylate transporter substrate binding protein [soil metagenome]
MPITRRRWLKSIVATTCAGAGLQSRAIAEALFPNRPLKLVVVTAPGGSSDVTARIVSKALEAELGQAVVVENRTGASGTIAASYVAKATADGYTLLFGTGSTHVIAPVMMAGVPYDPIKDFVPLTYVGLAPFVLFAGPSMKANTLDELFAEARKRPGQVTFGTTGPGTAYELAALRLEAVGNIKLNHVPYKCLTPSGIDVAGERIDIGVGPLDGFMTSDRIRILCSLGSRRLPTRPDVPTAADLGYPGFDTPSWAGVWAPAGTPPAIAARLSQGLQKVLARKDVQTDVGKTGIDVVGSDGNALDQLVRRQIAEARQVVSQPQKLD